MDETTKKRSCCLWNKLFRQEERCEYLENCEELLQYPIENKLLKLELPLHNSCFIKFYNKKGADTSNNSSQSENKSIVDVDTEKVDKAVQIDSISESSKKDINTAETKTSSTITTSTASSSNRIASLALPLLRLAKSHRKCSICDVYFSDKRKIRFTEINTKVCIN